MGYAEYDFAVVESEEIEDPIKIVTDPQTNFKSMCKHYGYSLSQFAKLSAAEQSRIRSSWRVVLREIRFK